MATKKAEVTENVVVEETTEKPKKATKKTTKKVAKEEAVVEEAAKVEENDEETGDDYKEVDPEDIDFDEEILEEEIRRQEALNDRMFEKRRYHMLDQDMKKKAYKTEHVVGADEDYVSESMKTQQEALELMNAAQAIPPKLLKGRVTGYETTEHDFTLVHVSLLEGSNFIIKIPVEQFFVYEKQNYQGDLEGKRRLQKELNSRINSEIEFVVYDVDEIKMIAYASRVKAMEIRSRIFYKDTKRTKKPLIQNGTKAMARVVSVKNNRVVVEVCGVETTMASEELSWKALDVLTEEFKVGDKFPVVVDNIESFIYDTNKQSYKLFKITASKRLAERNPAEKYYHQFSVGQFVGGIVKTHTPVGVFVELDGKMDCVCPPSVADRFVRGDNCIVEITRMDDEKKRIFGRFV